MHVTADSQLFMVLSLASMAGILTSLSDRMGLLNMVSTRVLSASGVRQPATLAVPAKMVDRPAGQLRHSSWLWEYVLGRQILRGGRHGSNKSTDRGGGF